MHIRERGGGSLTTIFNYDFEKKHATIYISKGHS